MLGSWKRALTGASAVAAALAFTVGTLAQNGAAEAPAASVPSSMPSVFADFPRPPAELPSLDYSNAWPQRWIARDDGLKGVIVPLHNPEEFPQGYRSRGHVPIPATDSDVEAILRRKPAPDGMQFTFGGAGSYGWVFARPDPDKPVTRARKNTADSMFKFVSAQQETIEGEPTLVFEHTWFAVYEPKSGRPRGVALVSPGLLGTPLGTLRNLSHELRDQGWLVVRMLCQPSRFTELVEFELDAAGDLEAQARTIATLTGNRSAECAYAVQAAMAHVESMDPELKSLPRVAVGFSGGAMTLPTIIARDPERYDAAILVGGGADFWLMNQRSNYRDFIRAVKETWKDRPSPDVLSKLDEAYLKQAPLDSYHTAAALKGKHVLMIQGTADKAVPAPLGDLLWERLGQPQRWLVEGATHESLFMNLQRDDFPRMMEWLNRACPKPEPKPEPKQAPKEP